MSLIYLKSMFIFSVFINHGSAFKNILDSFVLHIILSVM